jgi:hypothetical protein
MMSHVKAYRFMKLQRCKKYSHLPQVIMEVPDPPTPFEKERKVNVYKM